MGEAKRRRQFADSLFDKQESVIDTLQEKKKDKSRFLYQLAGEGVQIFPMGLLNDYYQFIDTIWEYPSEQSIYEGYSQQIKQYAESLEHSLKCDLWSFLLFVSNNKVFFEKYIRAVKEKTKLSDDNVLIYLWKRLHPAALIKSQCSIVVDNDGDGWENIEQWDKFKDVLPERCPELLTELKEKPESFFWKYIA